MRVVISQSMLFPWVGLLEQVRLADVFVHYDDVEYSKGSFVNRVQVKTPEGSRWLTVPLLEHHLGQSIDRVRLQPRERWQDAHAALLRRSLADAPFGGEALQIAASVYAGDTAWLGPFARASLRALANHFGIGQATRFVDIRDLDVPGSGSDRVLAVVRALGGTTYVTGHGAARYLDHEKFERAGVDVQYMDYRLRPYPQSHGDFTPYVSALDLAAHCGRAGAEFICSGTRPWRDFVDGSA
jgi:hypothetical protein